MKKNSTLQQKLKSYSALAGAATTTVLASDANAQVTYTDVSPDVTVNTHGSGYQLDMDNDGTIDFTIGFIVGSYPGIGPYNYVFAYSNMPTTNQLDTLPSPVTPVGATMSHNSGDNINAMLKWNIGAGPYYQHLISLTATAIGASLGDWVGDTDKYLAVKFDISGATHYGWVRMDVAANTASFTIKDYAYDATANTPILAGDMGVTGISNAKLENVRVFASNSIINVNMGAIENGTVIVRDMMGKEVYNGQLNSSFNTINMAGAATGIYTVTITSEGRVFTQKVSL